MQPDSTDDDEKEPDADEIDEAGHNPEPKYGWPDADVQVKPGKDTDEGKSFNPWQY